MTGTRVPMADLGAQHAPVRGQIERAISRVLASGRFVLGVEVERFERQIGEYLGVRGAIGVSSGTDALIVALTALGVGPGDEVLTTPFSFVATAEAIVRVGATPRFVDVEYSTFSLDPNLVEAAITPRTKAVLVVHLFGTPARTAIWSGGVRRKGVALVEDAAQAFGAKRDGAFAGTLGAFGCFSFFPTKVLGALGDAGIVVTNDDELALQARSLRQHGGDGRGKYLSTGGNFRMDAIQAAVLGAKLPHLGAWIDRRRVNAEAYDRAFGEVQGIEVLDRGAPGEWNGAVYTIRVSGGRRDALKTHLEAQGVESAIYYATPLHMQPAFRRRVAPHGGGAARTASGDDTEFPVSERAASEALSLPVHSELTEDQRAFVIESVKTFFAHGRARG